MQQLLDHFEACKRAHTMYSPADTIPTVVNDVQQDNHYRYNITLAWAKLDEYYSRTEETPVYVAAVVLHPRYNWSWILRHWSERREWITEAEKVLLGLWQHYRTFPSLFDQDSSPLQATKKSKIYNSKTSSLREEGTNDEDVERFGYSSDEELDGSTALDQWKEYTSLQSDHDIKDPYQWWWSRRHRWPQLTRMALDILTVPPMSDEPERTFSDTGCMVTDRRNRLQEDTINTVATLKSWTRQGVIVWTSALTNEVTRAAVGPGLLHDTLLTGA